jgi:hypothetical protein
MAAPFPLELEVVAGNAIPESGGVNQPAPPPESAELKVFPVDLGKEIARLLNEGNPPSKVAATLGLTVYSVMKQLWAQVGEGKIRRSDILFSIEPGVRRAIERLIAEQETTSWMPLYRAAKKRKFAISREDLKMYLDLRDSRVALGDMYELIRSIELDLHKFVKNTFMGLYGDADGEWWREGIPEGIRANCAASRERDPEPAEEAYCYTHFIDIVEILDKRWKILSPYLPKPLTADKQALLSDLKRINGIRNSVMHPVRGAALDEDDFEFVHTFRASLQLK